MAVQAGEIRAKVVRSYLRVFKLLAGKAWRLGIIVLVAVGLWIGLRSVTGLQPSVEPSLRDFMAYGARGSVDISGVYATAQYFKFAESDPAKLGMDPAQQIFFVVADSHDVIPSADTWWQKVSLSIDGKGDYRPVTMETIFDSYHHQTVALAFQPDQSPEKAGSVALDIPDLGDGARALEWQLPLAPGSSTPSASRLFPWALPAVLGGLLVAFSPCLIHMTTYYVPLFGTIGEEKPTGTARRVKMATAAGLFALGFTIPYSIAGVAVGYAGQFVKSSSLLEIISRPAVLVAGTVVMLFGLQVAGFFRLPFLMRLKLPRLRPGLAGSSGYLSTALLGTNLAVGCLGCVGGSLFAGMLLYSGAMGSPLQSGLTLLLFGLAVNAPFFLAAMTFGRFQLRQLVPLRVTRHIPLVSSVILITLGLIILSGTESIFEHALLEVFGISG